VAVDKAELQKKIGEEIRPIARCVIAAIGPDAAMKIGHLIAEAYAKGFEAGMNKTLSDYLQKLGEYESELLAETPSIKG
jgi:hypothetical protein